MISGSALVGVLIYLVVWALILYVLWWAIGKLVLPEPFNKIAIVILVVLTVVVLLNLLLGFVGTPLIQMEKITHEDASSSNVPDAVRVRDSAATTTATTRSTIEGDQ